MPKINVYLPQWLADAVSESDVAVSEVCQRALADATGRNRPMTTSAPSSPPKSDWWRHQPAEERAADLERAAIAIRYALAPTPTVPAGIKPIGAAQALAALRAAEPSFLLWEHKAQDLAGWAAAVEVAKEVGAKQAVLELLESRRAAAAQALDAVEIASSLGGREEILDLIASLEERAHPRPVR